MKQETLLLAMFQTRKFTNTIKNVFEATMSTINDNIESLPVYFLFSLFCLYMVILKNINI